MKTNNNFPTNFNAPHLTFYSINPSLMDSPQPNHLYNCNISNNCNPFSIPMIFLVFLGGTLMLFFNVTSLVPNEMFHLNTKIMISFPIIIFIMLTMDPYLTPILHSLQDS